MYYLVSIFMFFDGYASYFEGSDLKLLRLDCFFVKRVTEQQKAL